MTRHPQTVTFSHSVTEQVRIRALDITGIVTGLRVIPNEEILVAHWYDGIRRETWCRPEEIESA